MKLPPSQPRRGFTIIELLVVIAIIGVLAALIAGATMRIIGVQQQKNTENLIQKLGSSGNDAYRAATNQFYNEPIPPAYQANVSNLAGGDATKIRTVWVCARLKQTFPTSVAEASAPGFLPAAPGFANLAGSGVAGTPAESSACLYLALKSARSGTAFDPDTLSPRELVPTSTPDVKYFIDDWKQPIQFVRWPVPSDPRFPGLQNSPQSCPPAFLNPADPLGVLSDPNWNSANFSGTIGLTVTPGQSYKCIPVIYSNGSPSGVIISNYSLRIGGYSGG